MNVRIDLTEPKRYLDAAETALRYADTPPSAEAALAYAQMGMLAYTVAAAEAAMRAVDEMVADAALEPMRFKSR